MDEDRDPQTYAIIGAAMEVQNILGRGFLEAVYHEAIAVELSRRDIPFRRECAFPVRYKDEILPCQYRADLVAFDNVLIELKALPRLTGTEEAQILNYLKVSGLKKGLLINFGVSRLEYKRYLA